MQRHAESGPPAGPAAGRNDLRNVRTAENENADDVAAVNTAAVARTATAAASTPRGAVDDASDAGTDRDGATQIRKRGAS